MASLIFIHALSIMRYPVSRYFLTFYFSSHMTQSREGKMKRKQTHSEQSPLLPAEVYTEKRFKLWTKIGS